MKSPITHSSQVSFEYSIPKDTIINLYQTNWKVDVSHYFRNITEIEVYKCSQTGYKFYYPFDIFGKSEFYEKLQDFDWYYMPWKWEHEKSTDFIRKGDRILEVGCGRGDFLRALLKKTSTECIGLELNEKSALETKDLKIICQTIEEYSKDNPESFDIVCSFQVLEHIADIRGFLEGQIKCLRVCK